MSILNLTQHPATPDQIKAGVVEPSDKKAVQDLLTFTNLPDSWLLGSRAEALALLAAGTGCESAMIGGAPYFMSYLERALMSVGVRPLYSFSVRETEEQVQSDGSVKKVAVFRHSGFVGE